MPTSSDTERTWTWAVAEAMASSRWETVISASPTPTAVTRPASSTVATDLLELFHTAAPSSKTYGPTAA